MNPAIRTDIRSSRNRRLPRAAIVTAFLAAALFPATASADMLKGFVTGVGQGVGQAVGKAIIDGLGQGGGKASSGGGRASSGGGGRSRSSGGGAAGKTAGERAGGASSDGYMSQREARNFAAQLAELEEIKRSQKLEEERNVDLAISVFIATLEAEHQTLRLVSSVRASAGAINQVTAGEVNRAVEEAYKAARLYDFDRFAGEMWTRERLKVRIIRIAEQGLEPYFDGVGAKGPSMSDLDDLFARSARQVYANALEISEIVGVSNSFDRFIRTIFEYSDRSDSNLWTIGADGRYERLVTTVMDGLPLGSMANGGAEAMNDQFGLQQRFQFRFRARRALYDCLAAHYPELVSGKAGVAGGQGRVIEIKLPQSADATGEAGADRGLVPAGTAAPVSAPDVPRATTNRPVAPGGVEEIWDSASSYVRNTCRGALEGVAMAASQGQIQPVSARWNSAAADGAGIGQIPVVNSGNAGAYQQPLGYGQQQGGGAPSGYGAGYGQPGYGGGGYSGQGYSSQNTSR